MRIRTVILGAAAAALASTPVLAEGATRAAAPAQGESALGYPESATQLIVLALVAAAIILGITLTDGDDEPSSP
jgi:hypothetical protein